MVVGPRGVGEARELRAPVALPVEVGEPGQLEAFVAAPVEVGEPGHLRAPHGTRHGVGEPGHLHGPELPPHEVAEARHLHARHRSPHEVEQPTHFQPIHSPGVPSQYVERKAVDHRPAQRAIGAKVGQKRHLREPPERVADGRGEGLLLRRHESPHQPGGFKQPR